MLALLVFLVAAGLDFSLVRWAHTLKDKPLQAALWAVAVGSMGSFLGYVVYNLSAEYVIPELVGFFFGTYFAVKYGKPNH